MQQIVKIGLLADLDPLRIGDAHWTIFRVEINTDCVGRCGAAEADQRTEFAAKIARRNVNLLCRGQTLAAAANKNRS